VTVSSGPAAFPPQSIAALNKRLADLEATIARLQINRTRQPVTLGALSNVAPGLDGSGVANGQTLAYDKASGTYKPGTPGSSYPTLSYVYNSFVGATVLQESGDPMLIQNPYAGWTFLGDPVWAVDNGPAWSAAGTLWDQTRAAYPNKVSTIVVLTGNPVGQFLYCTIPWVAQASSITADYAYGNLTTPITKANAALSSGVAGVGGVVAGLPRVSTPSGPNNGYSSYNFQIRCGNLACTQWVEWVGSLNAIPPQASQQQMQASDLHVQSRIGTALGLGIYTTPDPLPVILTTQADVYLTHVQIGVNFNGTPV
jgi:hypothetical protein